MSSLLLPDETHASLDAALALLDNYDDLGGALFSDLPTGLDERTLSCPTLEQELELSSEPNSSVANVSATSSDEKWHVLDVQEASGEAKRKGVRAAPSAVKRGHKEDVADLHQQVTHLTARLSQLQKVLCPAKRDGALRERGASPTTTTAMMSRPNPPGSSTNKRSAAYQNAMLELQKLEASEKLNQKLKFAWRREAKIAKRLETLVQEIATLKSESVLRARSTNASALAIRDDSTRQDDHRAFIVTQLLDELVVMYHQTARICDAISLRDTSRVFSSSHVHNDHEFGRTLEFTTNTPLACSLEELDALLTSYLAFKQRHSTKLHVASLGGQVVTSLCYERPFAQKMESQFGAIHLNGVVVARKFDEPHRHVFAYTSKVALAGTDLRFQLDMWFIMTKQRNTAADDAESRTAANHHALLQQFCRIYRDKNSIAASSGGCALEHEAYFQDFILVTKGEEVREKLLHLQSAMMEQLGSSVQQTSAA
ncbi:hypothetical protein Gpo141_00008235 [Globisporangium polare]